MSGKTAAEIIAANDQEEAFLFMVRNHEASGGTPPSPKEVDAIFALAEPWAKEFSGDVTSVGALNKLTSDENRLALLRSEMEGGADESYLIEMFADDRIAAHRPLILGFFIEQCDDPGYYDGMLSENAGVLNDQDKLKLLERKNSLG